MFSKLALVALSMNNFLNKTQKLEYHNTKSLFRMHVYVVRTNTVIFFTLPFLCCSIFSVFPMTTHSQGTLESYLFCNIHFYHIGIHVSYNRHFPTIFLEWARVFAFRYPVFHYSTSVSHNIFIVQYVFCCLCFLNLYNNIK